MGLRAAVIELRRPKSSFRFVLFPMVHVAEPSFYEAVMRRLRECDMVVAEGIQGRSRTAFELVIFSYRLVNLGRLKLVPQDLDLESLGIPVIWPDMAGREFTRGWQNVPWWQRLILWCVSPVVLPVTFLFFTRARLAKDLALEDDHGLGGYAAGLDEVDDLLIDQRDRLLAEELTRIHHEHGTEPIRVAVVYGAQHMISVAHVMSARFGYVPRDAEWLTVFDY